MDEKYVWENNDFGNADNFCWHIPTICCIGGVPATMDLIGYYWH